MDILTKIYHYATTCPDRTAVLTDGETLTYAQLWNYSGKLAAWLGKEYPGLPSSVPLAVYGHKSPWMLVCFLACVRSGHSYCPMDTSMPSGRIQGILQALPEGPVLCTCPLPVPDLNRPLLDLKKMQEVCLKTAADEPEGTPDPTGKAVRGEDVFYIIFTSGSTGTPKGVMITTDCLNHYLEWSVGLAEPGEKTAVFLNQAPFSFDLSVMDLYTCLACGGTLFCLTKEVQGDYRKLMQALKSSGAQVWVSTPSFADVCLADPVFSEENLPELEVFLFCGETLTNKTAGRLLSRFPKTRVINTYGPTESTVCVTSVQVTGDLAAQEQPLPVGAARPGTRIEIQGADGLPLGEGEKGEIVIIGDTVSPGYYGQEELTRKAFFLSGGERGYRTGDRGYLQGELLYFCGRMDLQIKLHGYRIELEDIEANLSRLSQVSQAAVVPNERGGKITSLTAFIVPAGRIPEGRTEQKNFQDQIRRDLLAFLPEYMVPKKIRLVDHIPMTANGKADRRRLAQTGAAPEKNDRQAEAQRP